MLAFMFHTPKTYGLRKIVLNKMSDVLGDTFMQVMPIVESVVSPKLAKILLPSLLDTYPKIRNIDLRCDFNKDLLRQYMPNAKASEVIFGKGGKIDLDISTSCGIYVNEQATKTFDWKPYETFFVHMVAKYTVDFKDFEKVKKMGIKIEDADI